MLFIAASVASAAIAQEHEPAEFHGKPRVVDGDTIELEGRRIRLFGINVIERWNPLGPESGDVLRRIIGEATVTCLNIDTTDDGRPVGTCKTDDDLTDLSGRMVYEGWAINADRFTDDYEDLEAGARAARRGLWRALESLEASE